MPQFRCINASTSEIKQPVEGGGFEVVWQHARTLEVVGSDPVEHVHVTGALAAIIQPGKTYELVEAAD